MELVYYTTLNTAIPYLTALRDTGNLASGFPENLADIRATAKAWASELATGTTHTATDLYESVRSSNILGRDEAIKALDSLNRDWTDSSFSHWI